MHRATCAGGQGLCRPIRHIDRTSRRFYLPPRCHRPSPARGWKRYSPPRRGTRSRSSETRCWTSTCGGTWTASLPKRRCRWSACATANSPSGGAANVAQNVAALGARCTLVAGKDANGAVTTKSGFALPAHSPPPWPNTPPWRRRAAQRRAAASQQPVKNAAWAGHRFGSLSFGSSAQPSCVVNSPSE